MFSSSLASADSILATRDWLDPFNSVPRIDRAND
jgi:hypothetical protein